MRFPTFAVNRAINGLLMNMATAGILLSCSGAEENNSVTQSNTDALQSAGFVNDLHAKNTDPHRFYTSIQQMPLEQIAEIHTYFNIERWNAAKNQDKADDDLYEAGAKALQLPVKQLKEADDYYLYRIIKPLDTVVKQLYRNHPNMNLPQDNRLRAAAYGGMHTMETGLLLYAGKDAKEIKQLAASMADSIAATLPAWISGVKFTSITRRDTLLQTSDETDAGFIWKRGGPLKAMNNAPKGFGKWPAKECGFWDNPEWNDYKTIPHPAYKFLNLQAGATQP
ncbi:MAG: hypothetical protein EOO03_05510 [Chitinophagaceae bacterium]|nr:MAG: hypothetical protein EOO03_05510 [Chitinophagaceae bacterium]